MPDETVDSGIASSEAQTVSSDGPGAPAGPDAATVAAPHLAAVGSHIGRYKILERIGEGGMGMVYLAEQEHPIRRRVALKVIKPGMDTAQVVARFEAERQALALMDHPGIARVIDGGSTDSGRPYFVMEVVKGLPLTQFCDRQKLSMRDRLELFRTVCAAVQHAHQKGIIHRDLKPSNVLVSAGDDGLPVVKVIDFGIAKATRQSLTDRTLFTEHRQLIGTPHYMSPEQADADGVDVDTRTDIYALGVILYELLTGTTPLDPKQLRALALDRMQQAIREQEAPKPSTRISTLGEVAGKVAAARQATLPDLARTLRGDLDWIVMKALEKDRNRRYETATGFSRDVQRYLSNEPVEACPPSAAYLLKKFVRRNRVTLATAGGFAAVLVVATVVSVWQAVAANRARGQAVEALSQKASALLEEARQRKDADAARARADDEAKISRAVRDFLQNDLLLMADPRAQAERMLDSGTAGQFQVKRDPAISELLDRAAAGLEGDKLEARFPGAPRAQAEVLQALAMGYAGIGQPAKAVEHQKRARDLVAKLFPADDPDVVAHSYTVALYYGDSGKGPLAMNEIDALLRHLPDPTDKRAIQTRQVKARLLMIEGKYHEALPILEELLSTAEKSAGDADEGTRLAVSNLGAAHLLGGDKRRALTLFQRSYDSNLKHKGADHPSTLLAMGNLAGSYLDFGRVNEAVELSKTVLEKRRQQYGDTHPETLTAMNNLGMALQSAGQGFEAIVLFEGVLAALPDKVGAAHPNVLQTKTNLAGAYQKSGQLELAVPLFEEAVAACREHLGAGNHFTLKTTQGLANAYAATGKIDRGVKLLEEAAPLAREKLGNGSSAFMLCATELATLYMKQKAPAKGLPFLEDALAGATESQGADSSITQSLVVILAHMYGHAGEWDKCAQTWMKVVEAERSLPDARRMTGLINLLSALSRKPTSDAYLQYLREALLVTERAEPGKWRVHGFQVQLGMALRQRGEYADAEQYLRAAHQGFSAPGVVLPADYQYLKSYAIMDLAEVLDKTDRPGEAAELRKQLPPASTRPAL